MSQELGEGSVAKGRERVRSADAVRWSQILLPRWRQHLVPHNFSNKMKSAFWFVGKLCRAGFVGEPAKVEELFKGCQSPRINWL